MYFFECNYNTKSLLQRMQQCITIPCAFFKIATVQGWFTSLVYSENMRNLNTTIIIPEHVSWMIMWDDCVNCCESFVITVIQNVDNCESWELYSWRFIISKKKDIRIHLSLLQCICLSRQLIKHTGT